MALTNGQQLALPGQGGTAAPVERLARKLLELDREVKDIDKTITEWLAAVGSIWALGSLRASPGARRHFDARLTARDWNHQAQPHLFKQFLCQLHH